MFEVHGEQHGEQHGDQQAGQPVLRWSPSDLTLAAECEFALLRRLDLTLRRVAPLDLPADPLLERVARLGDQHEARALAELEEGPLSVVRLERARGRSEVALQAVQSATTAALASDADVVYQAGLYDGESLGYADFVERTDEGWLVCDAKLARQARPKALLQIAAYAEQLGLAGVALAPRAVLLLGNGQRESFPLSDLLPVFRERRARLRDLLAEHSAAGGPVGWGDERYVACGRCPDCQAEVQRTQDLVLVAGLRMDQRRRLRAVGIETLADLAAAEAQARPADLAVRTFDKLQAQARLQLTQLEATVEGEPPPVTYELTEGAAATLALLPAPSPGDLFFDFEGDPLYNEGDLSRWGLEYLWGVMLAPGPAESVGAFQPIWAHSSADERAAFVEFMELVGRRRAAHPDLHIYHYAPYETSALKRLAARYQTHEKDLDDLLRSAVFVDLYATVRGAVRVSQPSYSIKKLEPLYLGRELRTGDIQAGDVSIVEYHEYRALVEGGEAEAAAQRLAALADYNRYDCLSTLRLRDWLLERAAEIGVLDQVRAKAVDREGEGSADDDPLFAALMARAGPELRIDRTADEQAYAMLATALDYFRREELPFWWAHFDRLDLPVSDWDAERDVFVVDGHEVVQDWSLTGRATNPVRVLRLTGQWGPGSTLDQHAGLGYSLPAPDRAQVPEAGQVGWLMGQKLALVPGEDGVVVVTETGKGGDWGEQMPSALFPDSPPRATSVVAAIREVAEAAAAPTALPPSAALDLLARRPPRLLGGAPLPHTGDHVADVVSALLQSDSSYVAVQGPPGTGKTWTGARVIRELVERHGWRVGVVAQSHAVVEHMLDAVVEAGLDAELVGKSDPHLDGGTWTEIKNDATSRAAWLTARASTGGVLGGTMWTFTTRSLRAAGDLDLLVVDEAGQFALAPTIGSSVVAQRLLLLGDPQQLPQVSQGTHAEPVDESALGWLMAGHDTIPEELGYFLGTSYRMHPALSAKVSTLSYDGRLGSAPAAAARSLTGVEPGLSVITVHHRDNRTESVEEAEVIVGTVRSLLGTVWTDPDDPTTPRPLGVSDVLVVAPFNAQVNLLRRELVVAGLPGVRVGTVDKFQGQEAAVVIVSMTASSHGDVPRGMGFLLSRNRVNVAVSRAQWRAYLVRSGALTSYLPATTHELLTLGAFIGLCTSPDSLG